MAWTRETVVSSRPSRPSRLLAFSVLSKACPLSGDAPRCSSRYQHPESGVLSVLERQEGSLEGKSGLPGSPPMGQWQR